MPVKRRQAKGKLGHPPLIQQLLDGVAIEYSEEVNREVLDIYYFAWCDKNVPPEAIERAGAVLHGWWEAERNAD